MINLHYIFVVSSLFVFPYKGNYFYAILKKMVRIASNTFLLTEKVFEYPKIHIFVAEFAS